MTISALTPKRKRGCTCYGENMKSADCPHHGNPQVAAPLEFTKIKVKRGPGPAVALFCAFLRQHAPLSMQNSVVEYKFCPERRWRFDYAWPSLKIALEVEGGIWTGGRHTRGKGFLGDLEKYSEAAVRGWCVLRVTPDTLITMDTIELLRRAMQRPQLRLPIVARSAGDVLALARLQTKARRRERKK